MAIGWSQGRSYEKNGRSYKFNLFDWEGIGATNFLLYDGKEVGSRLHLHDGKWVGQQVSTCMMGRESKSLTAS